MSKSESIGELAAALAKAQGEIDPAEKTKANDFYRSKYADLAQVREAAREALTKNGLAVTQTVDLGHPAGASGWILRSTLMHSSGQWIESVYPIAPVKNDPQGFGSAITYARRFAFAALVGVASTEADDDGNEASGATQTRQDAPGKAAVAPKAQPSPKPAAAKPAPKAAAPEATGKAVNLDYVIKTGVHANKTLRDFSPSDAAAYHKTLMERAAANGKPLPEDFQELAEKLREYAEAAGVVC